MATSNQFRLKGRMKLFVIECIIKLIQKGYWKVFGAEGGLKKAGTQKCLMPLKTTLS